MSTLSVSFHTAGVAVTITDVDTVPVAGMAVVGVDKTNGTWQHN
ncbi:MAG: hypothetical protein P8K08_15245 [Fuerstiella sp.]|jgi:hypothetical protein|nr:hypothetical protein [Fuerstiella sp.]